MAVNIWLDGEEGNVYFNISGLDSSHSYKRYCRVIVNRFLSEVYQEQDITIPAYSDSYSEPLYNIDFEGGTTYEYFARLEWRSGGADDSPEYSTMDFYGEFYCQGTSTRPENFYWDFTKEQTISIAASKWNDFTKRINGFREFKGLPQNSFTRAISSGISGRNVATEADGLPTGALVSASIINEAIQAINQMLGRDVLPEVFREEKITAQIFNDMVEKLNSIS